MSKRKAKEVSEEEKLKQLAAQMRAMENQGLSETKIQEKERQKEIRKKENIKYIGRYAVYIGKRLL
ncbi:MAG: hypothetical protein LUC50_07285 [Ruminococcus sp.]|nr:hypothetical protein [Ruminococcus sp.]